MAFTFSAGVSGRKRDEDEEIKAPTSGVVKVNPGAGPATISKGESYNEGGRRVGDLPTVTPRNDEDDQPMVYDPGVNQPASEEKDQYADLHPEQYEYSWTEEQRKYYDDLSRQNNEALGLTEPKAETPKKAAEEKPIVYVPPTTNTGGTSGAGTNAAGTKTVLTVNPEGATEMEEQWKEYLNQQGKQEPKSEAPKQGTDRTAAANRQERRERGGADRAERNAPQGTFQPRTNQGSTAAPANDQPAYAWMGIRAGDLNTLFDLVGTPKVTEAPRVPDTGGQTTPAPTPQREPDSVRFAREAAERRNAAGANVPQNPYANLHPEQYEYSWSEEDRQRYDDLSRQNNEALAQEQVRNDYLAAWQRRQDEIDRRNLADSSVAAANAAREEQAAQERALEGSLAAAEANRYEMEQGAAQDRERRDQMAQLRAAKEEWDRQQREANLLATRDQDVSRMTQEIAAQMGYVPPETGGTSGRGDGKPKVEPNRAGTQPEVHSSGGGSSRGEVHYSYKGKPQTGGNPNRPGVNAEVNSWDQGTGTSAGTGTKGQEVGNGSGTKTVSGTGSGTDSSGNGKGSDVPKGSTYFTPSYGQDMEKGVKAPYRKGGYTAEEIEKMGNKAAGKWQGNKNINWYEGYYYNYVDKKYYPIDQIKANYYRENGSYAGWNEGMRDYWNTFGTFYGYRPGWRVDGRLGGGDGGGGYSGGGRSGGGYSYGGGSSSSGRGGGATANNGLYWNGDTSWNI